MSEYTNDFLYIKMCFWTIDLYASENRNVFLFWHQIYLRINFILEPLNKFRLILSVLGADALAPLQSPFFRPTGASPSCYFPTHRASPSTPHVAVASTGARTASAAASWPPCHCPPQPPTAATEAQPAAAAMWMRVGSPTRRCAPAMPGSASCANPACSAGGNTTGVPCRWVPGARWNCSTLAIYHRVLSFLS
jgi:hypothetical protein